MSNWFTPLPTIMTRVNESVEKVFGGKTKKLKTIKTHKI